MRQFARCMARWMARLMAFWPVLHSAIIYVQLHPFHSVRQTTLKGGIYIVKEGTLFCFRHHCVQRKTNKYAQNEFLPEYTRHFLEIKMAHTFAASPYFWIAFSYESWALWLRLSAVFCIAGERLRCRVRFHQNRRKAEFAKLFSSVILLYPVRDITNITSRVFSNKAKCKIPLQMHVRLIVALHRIVNRVEKVENQAECKILLQLHVRLWLRIA